MKKLALRNNCFYRFLFIASLCLFWTTYIWAGFRGYAEDTTLGLADHVIRFHVVANSNTHADQLLKEAVRDAVLNYMNPILKESNSVEQSRTIILNNLEEIAAVARNTVEEWGEDEAVYVTLDTVNFPTKSYGDVLFPAGRYEACRIVLGEGNGENWWCVMFPPLCYVDVATGVVPLEGKKELEEALTKEQYELVVQAEGETYKVKFKVVEWINQIIHPTNYNSTEICN